MPRIRITEAQAKLFGFDRAASKSRSKTRSKKRREDLPENIIVRQICDFLRAHGWTVTRQQSGLFTRRHDPNAFIRIGEKGVADWRAEKPIIPPGMRPGQGTWPHWIIYIEIKAPGRKPSSEQLQWANLRRATGTPAIITDDLEAFRSWYDRQPWAQGVS